MKKFMKMFAIFGVIAGTVGSIIAFTKRSR